MLTVVLPLSLALLVQGGGQRAAADTLAARDVIQRADSSAPTNVRRIAVTPEHLATAFDDERARSLLGRAREARLRQDSLLVSYDAKAYQRVSLGMGFKAIGRERLFLRHEAATRVRWRRGDGAFIDVIGTRYVVPAVLGSTPSNDDTTLPGVPYYPGRDDLMFGVPVRADETSDFALVHPIAAGGEAYYRYSTGDSASFRLPAGDTVRLIELRVRPREPDWRVVVGSLWFEAESAHLVRAVYRLATPVDASKMITIEGEGSTAVSTMFGLLQPMRATFSSLIIEHGLFEGRFWLPRVQMFEGEARIAFARLPVKYEERFDYASVNGTFDSLPDIPRLSRHELDSLRADTLGLAGDERRDWMDSQRRAWLLAYKSACDSGAVERTRGHDRHDGHLPVLVRMPCDTVALMASPELPPSIFDADEELFTHQDMEHARKMLGFGAQAGFSPQRPSIIYGPGHGLLRYNRVEGLSAGVGVRMELGAGFRADARAQFGTADGEPNAELAFERSDGTRTMRVSGYRRLAVANDWGTPLGFGSSVNAFLFGRDEGFYYRALGAEIVATGTRDARFEWRLFAERHDDAERETNFSLANAWHGLEFDENIDVDEGDVIGAGARFTRSVGANPERLRLFGDLRLEGATGDFTYMRGALDLTLSRSITDDLAGALTLSGGTTTGDVPLQRQFFLGGTQTVRGQTPGTSVGPAYWMARAELGTSFLAARPVVFYDVGWAGDRADWRHPGRPMSGAGVGASFLDGLVRLDVARGIWPRERWTMNFYLDARF